MVGASFVGDAGVIGLCEKFLEGGKFLHLEFDELVQLLVTLVGNSIEEFGSCFKDKVSSVNGEMVGSFGVLSNTKTNSLGHLFAHVGFGKNLMRKGQNCEKVWLFSGFDSNLRMVASMVSVCFMTALMSARLHQGCGGISHFSIVVQSCPHIQFSGGIFSGVPCRVHVADEFLDINAIYGGSVQVEMCEHFNRGMM